MSYYLPHTAIGVLDTVYQMDALDLMKALPSASVDMVLTSPPYGNLRTYNGFSWDFEGIAKQSFRALDIALTHGLPVSALRRYWSIEDGEPVGPHWEMTFYLAQDYERQHTEDSIHVGKPASEQVGFVYTGNGTPGGG